MQFNIFFYIIQKVCFFLFKALYKAYKNKKKIKYKDKNEKKL